MPASLTYPGVYVEEVPSGVRTIAGVSTSVAAFLGRTARGPLNEPTPISSWAEFERFFGGLDVKFPLSYAVRDFYQNGGRDAVISRVFSPANTASAAIDANGLQVVAASPGSWGKTLRVRIEKPTGVDDVAARLGVAATELFTLIVRDTQSGSTETFGNVTAVESPRRVDRVLKTESSLLRAADGAVTAPTAHAADPATGKTIWTDDNTSDGVTGTPADSGALVEADFRGSEADKTGIFALNKIDLFNLLCIPPDTLEGSVPAPVFVAAASYCAKHRAMLIVDPPDTWTTVNAAKDGLGALAINGTDARNAALYFPRLRESNELRGGAVETFAPCGVIAGIMARTDVQRGVWKAPAGIDAGISGALGLSVPMGDDENGRLNPLGINCLRTFNVIGTVVWGARTMRGADVLADEWKYIPVRRLALFLEESLYRGLQWVVFEPNDEPLWAQIRLNVGAFLQTLFRQGAFQGTTPREAYFVKCDKDTTTQNDINLGIVNIIVGFAPLKPAEFVVLKIQQMAGQIQT